MSEIEKVREQHERLLSASMNPIRRKMLQEIKNGITVDELRVKFKDLSDFEFKFNLEFLIAKGFVTKKNGELHLTDEGVELAYVP